MAMQFAILCSNEKHYDFKKKISLVNLKLSTYFKDLFSLILKKKNQAMKNLWNDDEFMKQADNLF